MIKWMRSFECLTHLFVHLPLGFKASPVSTVCKMPKLKPKKYTWVNVLFSCLQKTLQFKLWLSGLPAGLDSAVELVTGTDSVAANNEAATAGCNMAVGLVGNSLADHTEVVSVRRDKQSIQESVEWTESIILF